MDEPIEINSLEMHELLTHLAMPFNKFAEYDRLEVPGFVFTIRETKKTYRVNNDPSVVCRERTIEELVAL